MTSGVKRFLLTAAVACASLALALAAVEVGLRASGHRPWRTLVWRRDEPTFHDPDAELGWTLRPGHWRYGPYVPGGTPIEVTISSDRSRRTRADEADTAASRPEVLFLGCSFTFGWGVSDDETFAWGLQALRPDLDVRNRGTGAYGTWQSLLLLDRVLATGERPAHVIYGYIPPHAARNVGEPNWIKVLAAFDSQNIVAVPYCELGGGEKLVCHPPEHYPAWPLRESSAAITLLQDRWYELRARSRMANAEEVTRRLVAEMDARSRSAGARFSLLLLTVGAPGRDAILPFARAHGIDVIDCDQPLLRGNTVPGDDHPNGRVHRAWAACLADAIGN